jgi:thymidylate synthase ThyX
MRNKKDDLKMRTTKDLNVTFLGITPVLADKTGVLSPQEIVSLSSLLTFKGKSVQALHKDSIEKGQDFEKKIQRIMRKSSLKGHASIATTPTLCFSYEASKFYDSALTGMIFGSALMASGRRTNTSKDDIVYPTTVLKSARAKKIYQECSEKNIDFFNYLLEKKVKKDETSKSLQYGIYGTGIIQFPLESIITLKREWELEKDWLPEEIGMLLQKIEEQLKDYGVDFLYATRQVAPRNTYPYPHIFKNPANTNFVRDLIGGKKRATVSEIISYDFNSTGGLKKRLTELDRKIKVMAKDKKKIEKLWYDVLLERQHIARDYNPAVNIKMLSTVSWRVWGDKKRHRTVPMVCESVYYCADRAAKVFDKYKKQIKSKKINAKAITEIDSVYSVPPTIKANSDLLYQWLERALDSLEVYKKLISLKVAPRDAIFVMPRGLKIDVLQDYNLFNLIAGYYPLRTCSTVEEELQRETLKEMVMIKKLLEKNGLDYVAKNMAVKCQVAGFCLEEKTCGTIKALVKSYDEAFHQKMHQDLENRFQAKLKSFNK